MIIQSINNTIRWQPLHDKKDELPVFDKKCKKYIKHKKIETSYEHCQSLYYNGYAPKKVHAGNLGNEADNSLIKQYVIILYFI